MRVFGGLSHWPRQLSEAGKANEALEFWAGGGSRVLILYIQGRKRDLPVSSFFEADIHHAGFVSD